MQTFSQLNLHDQVQVFSFVQNLIMINDNQVEVVSYAKRKEIAAQWMIGIREITDDHSVHAHIWERHIKHEELLSLIDGEVLITLRSEKNEIKEVRLEKGHTLLVPQNVWHRLHVLQAGRMLFITPGAGSEYEHVNEDEK